MADPRTSESCDSDSVFRAHLTPVVLLHRIPITIDLGFLMHFLDVTSNAKVTLHIVYMSLYGCMCTFLVCCMRPL